MRTEIYLYPQKLILFLFFSFFLVSCETIDRDLIGEWELTEKNYLVTPSEDFTFYNPFGEAWQGIARIDDKEYDTSLFKFALTNVWPDYEFYSEEVAFIFPGSRLDIYFEGERYKLEPYVFDIASGIFQAEGVAMGDNGSIRVEVNMTMPNISMKKGEQMTLKNGLNQIPYYNIWFKEDGDLQADYLIGDIMFKSTGNWNVKNNRITFSLIEFDSDTYQYAHDGSRLVLSKEISNKEDYPSNLSPFAEKMSKITYQAIYKAM